MHKERILKFLNPGGSGILFTTPGVYNTGFDFLQQLSTPTMENSSFASNFPMINLAANNGDVFANKLKSDASIKSGLSATSSFSLQSLGDLSKIINKPTTFLKDSSGNIKLDKDGNPKKDFASSNAGKAVAITGTAVNMAGDYLNSQNTGGYKENNNLQLRQNLSSIGRLISSQFGPIGIGLAAADSMIEATGGKTDVSEGLGTFNDVGNMIASIALPGAGWLVKKTDKYSMSERLKTSGGYTGLRTKGEQVEKNAGAGLLFGRNELNRRTYKLKLAENTFLAIMNKADDQRAASNYNGISLRNQIELEGGAKPFRAKEGLKMPMEFKEGGKVNVIPSGLLHKNKHHMEDVGDEYKDLTSKGIPVVSEGDGGELILQAEIERDEIIFNIDVTRRLEELMEDGSDEAALEAGKLLATEIMENTIDNTGLIEEIV